MGHPRPSEFESRTNATYSALMWSLSRPGFIETMPAPGMVPIVESIIDRECRVHTDIEEVAEAVRRAGAELTPIEPADHVFAATQDVTALIPRLNVGSDLYPDDGATLVINATLGTGPALRLRGPGVDGAIDVRIDNVPAEIWTARRAVSRYPVGFEMFFVDGPRVLGIPRSAEVECL